MRSMILINFKKHFLFFLLIPIVIISQIYLLAPDLKIGLDDFDNGILYDFRQVRDKYPNNFIFLTNSYKLWGTYSHQYYYIGLLNYFFGTNFEQYHLIAHSFKIIATISLYFLFFFLSGSSLAAFLGAILFSVLPSSMGSLYGIISGNDYPAMSTLIFFLWIYLYLIKKNIATFKWLLGMLIFFLGSLLVSPERTLPIIILVLIFEAIWILGNHSKAAILIAIKRVATLMFPIFLFLILRPPTGSVGSVNTLSVNIGSLLRGLYAGRLDYLLNPFISFSSTFLPNKYWSFIGLVQTDNLVEYIMRLLTLPVVTVFIPTLFIAAFLSKKPLKFTLSVFIITMFGGIFSYFGALGHQGALINQAVAGYYILGLAVGFLMEYLENKNNLYFGLFFGPFIGFIFVLTMWLTSGNMDPFIGIHRYLTISSLFSCLFIGNIIVLLYLKINRGQVFLKLLALLPFLILIQIIRLNLNEIKDYYDYSFAIGYGYEDQTRMRQLLFPYYQNLSLDSPRIIYVDVHTDAINTQYYSNTIYAGWDAWPVWFPSVNFKPGVIPHMVIDYSMLKSWVTKRDGTIGIFYPYSFRNYNPTFYKSENFYAVRFVNRQLIDITQEIKKELKLND